MYILDTLISNDNKLNPQISSVNLKNKSQSKTGVDLHWHASDEYKQLNLSKKKELYEWQHIKEGQAAVKLERKAIGDASKSPKTKKRLQAKVKSFEAKDDDLSNQDSSPVPSLLDLESMISNAALNVWQLAITALPCVQKPNSVSVLAAAIQLQSILKMHKHNGKWMVFPFSSSVERHSLDSNCQNFCLRMKVN